MNLQESLPTLTIAAISDTHFGLSSEYADIPQLHKDHVRDMSENADLIVHCGDFTNRGNRTGARMAAEIFRESSVPVLGVLGNHDFNNEDISSIDNILVEEGGIQLLHGDTYVYQQDGSSATFLGACGYQPRLARNHPKDPEMAKKLRDTIMSELNLFSISLNSLSGKNNIVLLHFSPARNPRPEKEGKRPGGIRTSSFGQLIDSRKDKVKLVLHGHDHGGNDCPETTSKGIDMINIASPVTITMSPGVPYRLIELQLEPTIHFSAD